MIPEFKVGMSVYIHYTLLLLYIELISLPNVETATKASFPVVKISDGGKINPYLPVSLSSIV